METQQTKETAKPSEARTSAGDWGLRNPGLIMKAGGTNEVHEFTGMWPLKPDADLMQLITGLGPGGFVNPPGASFSDMTSKLGLIRAARWFVAKTQDFDGWTLFFVSQFDATLEKYFDDFVLNGKENLLLVWGQCIGCPTGPDVTARDVVEYIARGQIKTLACYDAYPSLSFSQVQRMADWYEKTRKFQRAVAGGDGNLQDKVNDFLKELAAPYELVPSEAVADVEVSRQWQYEDVADRVLNPH